jgi:hypothetical protein
MSFEHDIESKPQNTQAEIAHTARAALICDSVPSTTSEKDSLAATVQGSSLLNRMYEVAVETQQGTTNTQDFPAVYGTNVAAKLTEVGVTQITRRGDNSTVNFAKPLQFGDSSVTINVANSVSFSTAVDGGEATLNNISGVTASASIFTLSVNTVELQPRNNGYLSANVTAGFGDVAKAEPATKTPQPHDTETICVSPDGTISH